MLKIQNLIFISLLATGATTIESLATESVFAEENCILEDQCIDDRKFKVRIAGVSKRGNYVFIQLQYLGKAGSSTAFKHAFIIDNAGNESIIEGEELEDMHLIDRYMKVVSLKFIAEGFEWGNSFDLEVSGSEDHGTISFLNISVP